MMVMFTLPVQTKALELPKENEMPPRDKYTVFSRHAKGYRKGIHKVPKWTRVRIAITPIAYRSTHVGPVDLADEPEGFLIHACPVTLDIPLYHTLDYYGGLLQTCRCRKGTWGWWGEGVTCGYLTRLE